MRSSGQSEQSTHARRDVRGRRAGSHGERLGSSHQLVLLVGAEAHAGHAADGRGVLLLLKLKLLEMLLLLKLLLVLGGLSSSAEGETRGEDGSTGGTEHLRFGSDGGLEGLEARGDKLAHGLLLDDALLQVSRSNRRGRVGNFHRARLVFILLRQLVEGLSSGVEGRRVGVGNLGGEGGRLGRRCSRRRGCGEGRLGRD